MLKSLETNARADNGDAYGQQVDQYRGFFANSDQRERRKAQYRELVTGYFNLATDFYLWGWGSSFHFAPRRQGESLRASIVRYERRLADQLGIGPGCVALDLGCGVAGPLVQIARHTGASITGVNNNDYQLGKAQKLLDRAGLSDRCRLLRADFMQLPLPDDSCDAAYSIEAVPHAPDKRALFREVRRVLKPGGRFVASDWCLTDAFRDTDPAHQRIRDDIELGNGLPGLSTMAEVRGDLESAGLKIIAWHDAVADVDAPVPWYWPLLGKPLTPMNCLRAPWGRKIVSLALRCGERLRCVPRGATAVQEFLGQGADALVAGGEAGIFTPLLVWCARKPSE